MSLAPMTLASDAKPGASARATDDWARGRQLGFWAIAQDELARVALVAGSASVRTILGFSRLEEVAPIAASPAVAGLPE